MREQLLSIAEKTVEFGKKAGASDVWAATYQGRNVEYEVRNAALENVKDAVSQSLSVRLYVNGRYAQHSTTDFREQSLSAFIKEAVALTGALEPDPDRALADPALYDGRSTVDLQLADPGLASLNGDDRLAICQAQNALLAGQDKVISATSGVSDGSSSQAYASSNGFSGTREQTYFWLGSNVTLQGKGDKKPSGGMWGGGIHRADAPSPEQVAQFTLKRAYERLGSVSGPTAVLPLIVDQAAAARLLGYLLRPATASAVHRKKSYFAGKIGQKMFADALTLVDDPLIVGRGASRLFDSEGLAAKAMPIIQAGVLKNLYVNTTYGKKTGLAPTTGGGSNRVVSLGDRSTAELIAGVPRGVYLTGWLGGNANPTTGDFSFGLHGRLIEGGQLGPSIAEMNVTGNLLQLFSRLAEVGSESWPYGSLRSPALLFNDVQFSGSGK